MNEKNWADTRSLWPNPWPDHEVIEGTEVVSGVELRWHVCGNLTFRSTEILWESEDGRAYQDNAAPTSPTPTLDWDKALPFVDGWVRFDGCYHFDFGDGGYIHLCGNDGFDRMTAVLNRVRELATQYTEECR